MSIVRWAGLGPRMWRSEDSVNGFADTFESAGAFDSPNFAEEGLDRPVLDAGLNGIKLFEKKEGTRYTVTGPASWAQWNPSGANAFRDTGGFSLDADDVALVQALVMLSSDATNFGLDLDALFRIRIAWNYGGGGGTTTSMGTSSLANGTRGHGATKLHGILRTFVVIAGPVTVNWTELQYDLAGLNVAGARTIAPEKSVLMGFKYKRCRP